jgi:carbon-monoxide dehydrogenase medium subunit
LRNLKEYCLPASSADALEALGQYGENGLLVAGGTFVHGLEARGLLSHVEALIDLRGLGLDRIHADASNVRIGAAATFARVREHADLRTDAHFGALQDAMTYPPLQVRNSATVGGCVAAACPFFDVPTALLALDAMAIAVGRGGTRELPLADLFSGMFANSLATDEYLSEVRVPKRAGRSTSGFCKLEGNANDLAIVNAAVCLSVDAAGICTEARVALGGGVAETPVRSAAAERVLQGARLEAAAMSAAAEAVAGDIEPMSDHRASAKYRRAMAKVFTRRALARAVARLH